MPSSLAALPKKSFDYWTANHLLNRAGFGATPTQVRQLADMGLDDAVDAIVDFGRAPTTAVAADAFDADIMRPATEAERRQQRDARQSGDEAVVERFRRERQQRQRRDRRQMNEFQQWWLERMIETARPLEEKMTLFWHGHFATSYRGLEDSYHMFLQNQLFRTHATGNFRALCQGIIRDPAMLRYLNNNQNRRQRPNENLARELMELFTLGEGNDYTERDIKEGARALTGYTFRDDEFIFRPRMHDGETKTILGQSGTFDGSEFVDIILSRRTASEYLCLKLYRFFVNDLPGQDRPEDAGVVRFVSELAELLRRNEYDVKPVLRAMFRSKHFYSEKNGAAVIKSPAQLIVQAIRSMHVPTRNLNALLIAMNLMGQNLGFPPSVKGWDGGRSWINTSTLFVRHNTLVYLLTGRRPDDKAWESDGASYDATHLLRHLPEDMASKERLGFVLRFLLGGTPRPERVVAIEGFLDTCGNELTNDVIIGALALITAMPEYQLC